MATFDKFTQRARRVLDLAREEAQRLNHNYIGTEHLLLGLVRGKDGVAARVLLTMGVQLPKVRACVESIISRGEGSVSDDIGLTSRSREVIVQAADEARRLNHRYIGTEHLLLGMLREDEGYVVRILENLGVDPKTLRSQVMKVFEDAKVLTLPTQPPTTE